jgi:hypothetical protein
MAGIGASLAALSAVIGLLVASRWFRQNGGLLLIAALAIVASTLPYLLFQWTTDRDAWPWGWAHLVHDSGQRGWLRFEARPRSDGIAIQVALTLVAAAALAAQLALWSIRPARSRRPRRNGVEQAA